MKNVKIINSESPFFNQKGLATQHFPEFSGQGRPVLAVYIDGNPEASLFYGDEVTVTGPAAAPAATLLAYNQIHGKEFPITSLVTRVRSITERQDMDASVTKRLRDLRRKGLVNYEYDEKTKRYRKL